MILPEAMRVRWWLVPALYVVAPWLWLLGTWFVAGFSPQGSTIVCFGLATVGCGMTGLLHAMELTRWQVHPPLGFSLLLGAVAPFVIAGVVALILVPSSVVLERPVLEPMWLLAVPLMLLLAQPIGYAAIVVWFGLGSWLLLRPGLPCASATEPA